MNIKEDREKKSYIHIPRKVVNLIHSKIVAVFMAAVFFVYRLLTLYVRIVLHFRYPACPDHTEKKTLWELIKPDENAGIEITESYAMTPTAAVSGCYFSYPESKYFWYREDPE